MSSENKELTGKADPDILKSYVFPYLGVSDDTVIISPRVGYDAGVFRLRDDKLSVIATDPILGVPITYFGFFVFHYAASDVAVFGAKPKYLVNSLTLPENFDLTIVKNISLQLHKECQKYGVSVITGHTGFYPSVTNPIANSTVIGFVDQKHLILPHNAQPGDLILLTKNLGLEVAVMMAFSNRVLLKDFLTPREIDNLKVSITQLTVVEEALLLSQNLLVDAMHDVTEGGLSTALPEMADASKLGFIVYEERLPYLPVIEKISSEFNVNPLAFSSTGTLLAAVPPEKIDETQKILSKRGIKSTVIGKFVEDQRIRKLTRLSDGSEQKFPEFLQDPYTKLIEL